MRPLADWTPPEGVRGVLFDIDDTLTTDGRLTAAAYTALERLHAARYRLVPITGRPAGWCDHIARVWPVDAVIGENGAFYFCRDRSAQKLIKRFHDDAATRAANRARLAAVRDEIVRTVAGSAVASDQEYRETDLAIDYCEDVPRLADAAVDRIVAIMRAANLTAKMSASHVNGWYGDYDKLTMTRRLCAERFAIDLDRERTSFVFVGDSPNDASMFAYFPHSVGVANIRLFEPRLEHFPAYVTQGECGAGFAEVAEKLLAADSWRR